MKETRRNAKQTKGGNEGKRGITVTVAIKETVIFHSGSEMRRWGIEL